MKMPPFKRKDVEASVLVDVEVDYRGALVSLGYLSLLEYG
jgi:hypothetical protein